MTVDPPPTPSLGHPEPRTAALLNLKVRFSHFNLPDISLPLPAHSPPEDGDASSYSVNNLKGRIRAALPEGWRKHGLKLVYGGRVLDGHDNVVAALKVSLPSLRPTLWASSSIGSLGNTVDFDVREHGRAIHAGDETGKAKAKGKGKGKERASDAVEVLTPPIYVHCAITPAALDPRALQQQLALEDEPAPLASRPVSALAAGGSTPLDHASSPATSSSAPSSSTTAQPHHQQQRPLGFDRLLEPSSGFSASDVSALREQFRRIISNRYTPDTMPSPSALRGMEEAWLEDSSSLPAGSAGARAGPQPAGDGATGAAGGGATEQSGEGGAAGGYNDDDASAALDDTFYGVFMGFFWPLGACVWGLREEGVWSRRRGWAVLAGVMVNIGFGVVRVLS